MTAAEAAGERSSADAAAKMPAIARPTGVATTKPAFFVLEQHARRGERVQRQEAGARDERERDEEEAGVAEPPRRLSGQVPEHDAEERA